MQIFFDSGKEFYNKKRGGHFLVGPVFEGPNSGYPLKKESFFFVKSLVNIKKGKVKKFQILPMSHLAVRYAKKRMDQFDPPPFVKGLKLVFWGQQ